MVQIIVAIVFFVLLLMFLYFQVKVLAKASDKLRALCLVRVFFFLVAGVFLLIGIIGYSPENFDNWEQRHQQYVQNAQTKLEVLSDIKAKLGDDMQNSSDVKKDVYAEYWGKVNEDLKNVQAQANVVLPEHPNRNLLTKIGLWVVGVMVSFIIALLVCRLWKVYYELPIIVYSAVMVVFIVIGASSNIIGIDISFAPLMCPSEDMLFYGIVFIIFGLGLWGVETQLKKLEDKH